LTGADLINTASVSYRDPAGVLHALTSNTVVVTVDALPPTDPVGLPDPDISSIDGHTYTTRDTISFDYHGSASGFNWEFLWLGNSPSTFGGVNNAAPGAGTVFPVPTGAPRLSLGNLSLPTGRYTVRIQGVKGSSVSKWTTATITLVSTDLSTARVFPNPWRAARGDGSIVFDQMSANSTIKIFTMSGRLAKTLSAPGGSVSWDLTNETGEKIASGLYLYLITDSQGNKTKGKLAIIR